MAAIQRRGESLSVVFRDAEGRQRRATLKGTRKQAEHVAATVDSLLSEIKLGRIIPPKDAPTAWYTSGGRVEHDPQTQGVAFSKAIDAWHARQDVPPTTASLIATHVRRLKEHFGQRPVSGIGLTSIQAYVEHRKQVVIGRTIKRELCTLRSLLKAHRIRFDWAEVALPTDAPETPYRVLSDADVAAMIDAARAYSPVLGDAAVVIARTGVRRSELARIKAADLTPDGLLIHELKKSRGRGFTVRLVPVSGTVRKVLNRRIEQTPDGSRLFPPANYLGAVLYLALKGTRFEGRGFHDFRKRAASKMLANGIPVPAAAAMLGHTPEVMLRTYAKPYASDMQAAVALL